jgi:uncharacterized membrane protein
VCAIMKAQLLKSWDNIRSSFWFVPALMAVGAVMLAIATVAADRTSTNTWLRAASWVYSGSAEGASVVLGTIAGSMITIAGVVFSMTLVALSLASSQLGPRLLRNFMRDKTNQMVLGTFVATFVYCLLVLRTIRRVDEGAFVPHVSVTIGVLFALASLAVLIHFIHHVSLSIQADEIRQQARSNAAVTVRLLESIITIGSNVRRAQDKSALALQADLIFRGATESLPEWDRREIEERYIEARNAVAG